MSTHTRKTLLPTLKKVLGLKVEMYRIENRWCYAIYPPEKIDAEPIWVATDISGLNPYTDIRRTEEFWREHVMQQLRDFPHWETYVQKYQAWMWKKHPQTAGIYRIPKQDDARLAKYLADYLTEELARSTSPALWGGDLEQFADNLPDMLANGIEAFRGGAAE